MLRDQDWLGEARAELEAARHLLAGGHWSWCCFTCQQAAEKALKAVGEHFRDFQTGHNLNLLLQVVEAHTPVPDPVRRAGARLNRYYIATRYPNAFDQGVPARQFFDPDARESLADAEEVVSFAGTIIPNP